MPKNDVNYKRAVHQAGHMAGNARLFALRRPGQRIRACLKRDLKQHFLARIGHTRNIRAMCKQLRISPNTFYHWLHIDPVFAAHYQQLAEPPLEPFIMPTITVDPNNVRRRMLAALRQNEMGRKWK